MRMAHKHVGTLLALASVALLLFSPNAMALQNDCLSSESSAVSNDTDAERDASGNDAITLSSDNESTSSVYASDSDGQSNRIERTLDENDASDIKVEPMGELEVQAGTDSLESDTADNSKNDLMTLNFEDDEDALLNDDLEEEDVSNYDIANATISKIADVSYDPQYGLDECLYLSPDYDFTVSLNGSLLSSYQDYDYETDFDYETGKGILVITGQGEYFGTKTVRFNVVADFKELNVRCYNKKETIYFDGDDGYYSDESETIYSIKNATYTGKPIKPNLTVEVYWVEENGYAYDEYGNEYGTNEESYSTLEEGVDYKLVYKNNVNPGTATVSVVGIGLYKGTINETFKIKYPISKAKVSKIAKQTYKGKAIKPKPTVKCMGKTLKLGTDYTLSYKKNKQGGKATIVIKGKGNYCGTLKKTFKIYVPMKRVKVKKIPEQCLYSKAAKPSPKVYVGSVKLKYGRDYKLKYANNKKAGKATVTIIGKGYYKGKIKANFVIIPKGTGSTITKAEFNKIKTGMSYKKVKYLIGGAGSLTNDYSYENYYDDGYYDEDDVWVDESYTETIRCTTYEWKGNKSYSGASISFENGCVTGKSQWGL